MSEGVLLVFSRAPIPQYTKTRLIGLLGGEGAARFHQAVLFKMLVIAEESDYAALELWCDGDVDHWFLKQCAGRFAVTVQVQQGDDLGDKMYFAMQSALARYDFAAVIGSDCPSLTGAILNQSYRYLQCGKDAVLGPAVDGGYYLLGLREANPSVFRGITWGGADVAEQTRENFADLKLGYVELETLADVDTAEDYLQYRWFV